jgi:YidC/Oxa1 family membrane protein insertase
MLQLNRVTSILSRLAALVLVVLPLAAASVRAMAQAEATAPAAQASQPAVAAPAFKARVPAGTTPFESTLRIGSLDPDKAPFEIELSPVGAGISKLTFSQYWKTVEASNAAKKARAAGDESMMPSADQRYVLLESRKLENFDVPALALRAVEIDGVNASLFGSAWGIDASGAMVTEITDAAGNPVARVSRSFTKIAADPANPYLLTVEHRIDNLDSKPHSFRLIQYGPGDPVRDPTALTEVRRFHFGYLFPPERDESQSFVTANGQVFEHADVLKRIGNNNLVLWPNDASKEGKFGLVWFGSTDRYFSLAVHAAGTAGKRLESVEEVRVISNGLTGLDALIFSTLWSPAVTLEPAASTTLPMGVYAGPLDPKRLDGIEPYRGLSMGELIVYAMSGCCSWCTFAWLADGLLWFLTFIHDYLVFDWGIAIIVLVIVVRALLHPMQKKSQISMQRFSRVMAAVKPEIDALQKRYKDDPARFQQEQMRLMKEKGINPVGCVGGMIPMFAQMPIWMALYAVLYFAFPLRHQAPFFGVFQSFGDWSFLADLSAPDRFISFTTPINLVVFSLSSINLLPLLMGVVFWIQQQYMTPPTPNMSEEQKSQQRIMKVMMTVMFPLMMYVVPSGLTLYIFTSTCIGIVEGRIIRKQVDAMDLTKPPEKKRKQDWLGRMYEQALERKQQSERQAKKFKER